MATLVNVTQAFTYATVIIVQLLQIHVLQFSIDLFVLLVYEVDYS